MASTAFDLHTLLPQRTPLDAFRHWTSESEAFSAAVVWITVLFAFLIFGWVLYQWLLIRARCSRAISLIRGITPENAAEHRERLWQQGDALWREWDASLIEEHDPTTGRTWLRRTVDASQVFNEHSLAHGLIDSRLVAATPGLLTAFGVLGAFAGLQLGLKGLNLTSGEIEKSIPSLVANLSVKFSASIWGIGTSIFFNLLEKAVVWRALAKIRYVQSQLDCAFPRYTAEAALARLQTSSIESEKILRGLATAIGGQMQQALAQVGQFTSQAIGDAMKPAVVTLTEAADRLTTGLSTNTAEGLSEGISTAAQRMQESLERVGDRYNQQFIELSGRLTEAFEGLQTPVSHLSQTLGRQETALARAVERLNAHAEAAGVISGAANTMQSAAERLTTLRDSWELSSSRNESAAGAQERAAQTNERVSERFGNLAGQLDDFRSSIDAAARVVGSFNMPMQDLKSVLAGLPDIVRDIEGVRQKGDTERDAVMQQITGDLAETIRKAAEQLSGHAQVAESLRVAADRMGDSTKALGHFAQQISEGAARHEKAALAAENAAASNARAAGALEALPVHIGSMHGSLTQTAGSLKETANLTVQGYTLGAEQQRRFLQGLADGLDQFGERIRQVLQVYGDSMRGETQRHVQDFGAKIAGILSRLETLQSQLNDGVETVQEVASRMRNGGRG